MNTVIIVNNSLFTLDKTTMVYIEGKETEVYPNIDPPLVLGLARHHNASTIYVNGNRVFNEKYIKSLKELKDISFDDLQIKIVNGIKKEKK